MEYFRHKVWLVAEGHMTKVPITIMYASVVSIQTVTITMLIAAFNDLDMKSADIFNA